MPVGLGVGSAGQGNGLAIRWFRRWLLQFFRGAGRFGGLKLNCLGSLPALLGQFSVQSGQLQVPRFFIGVASQRAFSGLGSAR
jgi:hypothetical protein